MQRLDELGRTLLAEDGEDPEGVDLFATSEAEADLSLNSSSLFFFFFSHVLNWNHLRITSRSITFMLFKSCRKSQVYIQFTYNEVSGCRAVSRVSSFLARPIWRFPKMRYN